MSKLFARIANAVARAAGHPVAFVACVAIIVAWSISGPLMQFSETWQLLINTGTTIITFLMVFLVQNTQNRDGSALHAKLDELIRSSQARNALIGLEALSQQEVDAARLEIERGCDRACEGDSQDAD